MKKYLLLFLLLALTASAQRRDNTWCFGDSIKINFNGGHLNLQGMGSSNSIEQNSSISDSNGNLLFYVGANNYDFSISDVIWNKNDQIMQNGDSLYGDVTFTNGSIIIPFIGDSDYYYVMTIGAIPFTSNLYLYYSVVNMNLNGGLGAVTLKNKVAIGVTQMTEKLAAVKHANGKDWWILTHLASSNLFYELLIDSAGLNQPDSQLIGTNSYFNPYGGITGQMVFSPDGSKLAAVSIGIVDLFDFDRCTGLLSNWKSLAASDTMQYYGCSFSPNGTKLYVSTWNEAANPDTVRLLQFDLTAADVKASLVNIFNYYSDSLELGQLRLSPDGKIYMSASYGISFPNQYYSFYNMNLSVINAPDSTGLTCNFSPFSVYLGGRRCYAGLPNEPNYNLGALNCDVGVNDFTGEKEQNITVYPNPNNGDFTISFKQAISNSKVEIFNMLGEKIGPTLTPLSFGEGLGVRPHLDVPPGVYIVKISDGERQWFEKVIVE